MNKTWTPRWFLAHRSHYNAMLFKVMQNVKRGRYTLNLNNSLDRFRMSRTDSLGRGVEGISEIAGLRRSFSSRAEVVDGANRGLNPSRSGLRHVTWRLTSSLVIAARWENGRQMSRMLFSVSPGRMLLLGLL